MDTLNKWKWLVGNKTYTIVRTTPGGVMTLCRGVGVRKPYYSFWTWKELADAGTWEKDHE